MFSTIKIFRIPKNIDLREKWIQNISQANNEQYCGNGSVCISHFVPDQIQIKNNKSELLAGAIPTQFLIEVIDAAKEDTEENEFEATDLNEKMLRERLDFEIKEYKLNNTIKQQSNEISDLKEKLVKSNATTKS